MNKFIDRLLSPPWWVWPTVMVTLAAATLAASWILTPGPDEFCYLGETRFGGECGFTMVTGLPCPQCGMTRAFVHAARGHLLQSFFYSPGGLGLFLWIQAGGVIGAMRLVTRNPARLTPPFQLLFAWAMGWIVFLYMIPWGLRIGGINPLP